MQLNSTNMKACSIELTFQCDKPESSSPIRSTFHQCLLEWIEFTFVIAAIASIIIFIWLIWVESCHYNRIMKGKCQEFQLSERLLSNNFNSSRSSRLFQRPRPWGASNVKKPNFKENKNGALTPIIISMYHNNIEYC